MSNTKRNVTLVLMDPPYESTTTTSALRLIEALLIKKHAVNVFAYEGATSLGVSSQKGHANTAGNFFLSEDEHLLPGEWISSLFQLAKTCETQLNWTNCGICMDERGIDSMVEETCRGEPAQLAEFVENSDITLVIPTKRNC